jgi:hypothetical protein
MHFSTRGVSLKDAVGDHCHGMSRCHGMPRSAIAMTMLSVLLILCGCSDRVDRSGLADDLEQMMEAQHGVDDAFVDYGQQSFGVADIKVNLNIEDDSSPDVGINAAVVLIDELDRSFPETTKSFTVHQDDASFESLRHVDGNEMADLWPKVLELRSEVDGGSVGLSKDDSPAFHALKIKDTDDDAADDLAAVRTFVGGDDGDVDLALELRPEDESIWEITYPFSADAEEDLVEGLDSSGIRPLQVSVSDGNIGKLSVLQDEEPDAEGKLSGVIDKVGASTKQPWEFSWNDDGLGTPSAQPNFEGTVSVGGCTYQSEAPEETAPAQELSADAIDVRDALREKYDTCG